MFTHVHFLDGVEDFPPEAHWAFNLLLKLRSPSVLGLNITSSRLDSYLNLKSGSFFPPNWTLKTGLLPAPLLVSRTCTEQNVTSRGTRLGSLEQKTQGLI